MEDFDGCKYCNFPKNKVLIFSKSELAEVAKNNLIGEFDSLAHEWELRTSSKNEYFQVLSSDSIKLYEIFYSWTKQCPGVFISSNNLQNFGKTSKIFWVTDSKNPEFLMRSDNPWK